MDHHRAGKVIVLCGKICSGKTYYAGILREKLNAVVLSPDEATWELLRNEQGPFYDVFSRRLLGYLTRKAGEIAMAGAAVVLERGLWTREEREEVRAYYRSQGIPFEIHYVKTDDETWKRNIEERNRRVLSGEGGPDFYLDDGLMKKLLSLWEEPAPDEADVIFQAERKEP